MRKGVSKKLLLRVSIVSALVISASVPFLSPSHPQRITTQRTMGEASIQANASAHPLTELSTNTTESPKKADFSLPFFGARVNITTYGTGVTPTDIQRVKTLLAQVNSVARIRHFLGMRMNRSANIILVQNAAGYSQALKSIGVPLNEASSLSEDSNGFTLDSTIIIPLFENTSDADLANTLTHELTHVNINQHISNIPSWMNEGMAVYMGMNGQESIQNQIQFQGDERQYAEDILSVVQSKQLVPLTGDEAAILSGQENYDYELQDWLAVCDLISKYGKSSIATLAHHLENESPDQAFLDTFGETVTKFNSQFTKQLEISAAVHNSGARLQISFSPVYKGYVLFQGPNQAKSSAFVAEPGQHTVIVKADGAITTDLPAAGLKASANPPDPGSMYVSLIPSKVMKVGSARLDNGDFQISISNGLYSYNGSWEELQNNPMYKQSNSPSILGVSIVSIHDASAKDPILEMLNAEKP